MKASESNRGGGYIGYIFHRIHVYERFSEGVIEHQESVCLGGLSVCIWILRHPGSVEEEWNELCEIMAW